MASTEELTPDEIFVEVDGDGVHLDTLDTPAVLAFASAYLNALVACAEEAGEVLEFRGLRALEKCGALSTLPNDISAASRSMTELGRLLGSASKPGHGLAKYVQEVRSTRDALPSHYSAFVRLRDVVHEIPNAAAPQPAPRPYASTFLRVQVQRVGGMRPRAFFASKSEARSFSIAVTHEQARRLGAHLYEELDIEATTVRDHDGHIADGQLQNFYLLSSEDPMRAWNRWFQEAGILSLDQLKGRH